MTEDSPRPSSREDPKPPTAESLLDRLSDTRTDTGTTHPAGSGDGWPFDDQAAAAGAGPGDGPGRLATPEPRHADADGVQSTGRQARPDARPDPARPSGAAATWATPPSPGGAGTAADQRPVLPQPPPQPPRQPGQRQPASQPQPVAQQAQQPPEQQAPAQQAPAQQAPAQPPSRPAVPPAEAPPPSPGLAPPAHARDSERARQALLRVRSEVAKAVVGQDAAVSGIIICLLSRGHILLEGVPGVAKTLLIRSVALALDVDTKRVQFTPDLMPGDITGSLIYDNHTSQFSFREGPVFTNLMLADEINRTPPKTQASLLEAMEERQVSVEGRPRPLPMPFMVAATQNPVEYEGTYPLPEAQLDRFLLKVVLPLPPRDDEIEVVQRHAHGFDPRNLRAAGIASVAGPEDLVAGVEAVRRISIAPEVAGYIVDICRATRSSPSLSLGASPRGATALLATSRAWAWMNGRTFVTPDDVKALAQATLSHRLSLRAEAELEGVNVASVLSSAIASVPVPR